jgi:hypothetical protein
MAARAEAQLDGRDTEGARAIAADLGRASSLSDPARRRLARVSARLAR